MTIGIVGGGQLARMLALEGHRLGQRFVFLEPRPEAVLGLGEVIERPYEQAHLLSASCNAVTYELENVPTAALKGLPNLWPPLEAVEIAQDRLFEKQLFAELGIPHAPYSTEMPTVFPALAKTRRLGYDGRGQRLVHSEHEVRAFQAESKGPWIFEQLVPFQRELSSVAVRSRSGETRFYPLTENRHEQGILRESKAPARGGPEAEAQSYVRALLDRLAYCGVLAVEWFEVEGRLVANEIAPRVHNSGHWTLGGAPVSQFENHLRAGLGMPLGDTTALGACRMVNLLGEPTLDALSDPRARVHLYGKSARAGRKVGHVTWVDGP